MFYFSAGNCLLDGAPQLLTKEPMRFDTANLYVYTYDQTAITSGEDAISELMSQTDCSDMYRFKLETKKNCIYLRDASIETVPFSI